MSLRPNDSNFEVSLPAVPWRAAVEHHDKRNGLMPNQQELEIRYSESDKRGRYRARVVGVAREAELTISKVTPSLIIADHTFVPDDLGGRGIAQALVAQLIADARLKEQRIVPLCPFVRSYAQKHREALIDVIQW